ncbi:hypothetical protein CC85DRAFT_272649 [Cutaneotrichosporon oleaginosum]|uniref:FAD-binding FR-type domain-containing protein n=1 Tax=Cutaneotrichosporon oleaginosum TaxID=879819 RepID=A0A0J0XQJ4_9TREE|nr:uncharacterized protein CC85DRAFT_272649 [Cutaneotrichosporon oleaginosum]KLT43368.1 hypothetical protein CC85DRAFT_272649 [Cutaneotrichosporon oleaginosum]
MDLLLPRGPPTAPPPDLVIHNASVTDHAWQRKFTIIWASVIAFSTLCSIPWILRAIRQRRLYAGLSIRESDVRPAEKTPVPTPPPPRPSSTVTAALALLQSAALYTPRLWRRASLSLAQMALVAALLAAAIACWTTGADLKTNSNRAGYLALAHLPLLILLALKTPLPLPVFLPSLSYEHYNFLHRWAGRSVWLAATVHMACWLNQYISTGQWDQVWKSKSVRGMVAYAMLCMVAVTSIKPVRRRYYQIFWASHVIFFVGFFAGLCYHTSHALSWVYVCAGLYAYDLFARLLRYRLKDATLVPIDATLTMIYIPDCDAGWLPTQHVHLRVLRGAGIFEAHPFTITNAPPAALRGNTRGIVLYVKVAGDWTRRVHRMAGETGLEEGDDYELREALIEGKCGAEHPGRRVTVMLDGPYGGLKMDFSAYGRALVIAGGSGVTFLLGTIEEILTWRQKGQGPGKVTAAWAVRDLSTIEALAPTLTRLHELAAALDTEIEYALFLTDPPATLPPTMSLVPSATLTPSRPEVPCLVREALGGGAFGDGPRGLAVIAAGPEALVTQARNAVAGISVAERVRAGGIGFHDEVYAL